jgi:hypothetical protein
MHKHTESQKKAVLDLFKQGLSKKEISERLNLPYPYVVSITPKTQPRHYLSDRALRILKRLNEVGYYFPKNSGEYGIIRRLKEITPIHFVRIKGKREAYMRGHENEALKAFLEHYHLNYLSSQDLASIRNIFGFREERYKYKPYKKQRRNKEENNEILSKFFD